MNVYLRDVGRIDYANIATRTIHELKPNNIQSIRQGISQAERYQKEANRIGLFDIRNWTIQVDTY